MRRPSRSKKNFLTLALWFQSGLILIAIALGWLLNSPAFTPLAFTAPAFIWGLLATLPPLLLIPLCLKLDYAPINDLMRLSRDKLAPLFVGASLLQLALISALAGIGEEALFRGVIQGSLIRQLPPWLAVLLASILFGLVHFITPTYALFATLFGLYLGWLTVTFDNLLVAMLVHGGYDFIVLTYLVRQTQNTDGPGAD